MGRSYNPLSDADIKRIETKYLEPKLRTEKDITEYNKNPSTKLQIILQEAKFNRAIVSKAHDLFKYEADNLVQRRMGDYMKEPEIKQRLTVSAVMAILKAEDRTRKVQLGNIKAQKGYKISPTKKRLYIAQDRAISTLQKANIEYAKAVKINAIRQRSRVPVIKYNERKNTFLYNGRVASAKQVSGYLSRISTKRIEAKLTPKE
jgi:hypothetical protein